MAKRANGRKQVENYRGYRKIFLVFVGICILTIGFGFRYYTELHETIEEESADYLQEVASRIGTNINSVIKDNFTLLHAISGFWDAAHVETYEQVYEILDRQKDYGTYEDLILLGEAGRAYSPKENKEVFLNLSSGIIERIMNEKEAMSTTQVINNKEYIIFFVALDNVEINGQKILAIGGSYSASTFEQFLNMTSFDKKAYSQIITKTGTVVTRPTSKYAINAGYNIFTTLEKKSQNRNDFAAAKDNIAQNKNGQVRVFADGEEYYMVYTSIQPEEWYLLTFVPVQVVNERSEMLLRSTLIICAVIALVFAGLVALLVHIFSSNERKLRNKVYVDDVTGGNTIQCLYELAEESMKAEPDKLFALVYTNLEKFKTLNEQIGRENCDKLLSYFDSYMNSVLTEKECIGRISADNFCVFMEYTGQNELISRLVQWRSGAEQMVLSGSIPWGLPSIEFGVYIIEDKTISFPLMIDRAKLALKESSRAIDSKTRYAFYDDAVRRRLFREKQLEDRMEEALQNGEFQVYLQPKYSLPSEKVNGAEALVRWVSPEEGMIYPNEFISLFEKNGFVVKLDLWVFEQVCRTIRRWEDKRMRPIKVSVNCSRAHLKESDFLNPYIDIAGRYSIPKGRIEIELTESMVLDDVNRLRKVIEDIKLAGFGCSMDDFGSGYSSLNLIQTIPVDTLKLDRIFFRGNISQSERTEAVVESIINMSKALSMETVAEGVELREQVEMLKGVGCDYIQGFVFAKPMVIESFEKIAFDDK